MDIVFHRNCLDGAYSAYLLYLFTKTLPKQSYQKFFQHLKSHYQRTQLNKLPPTNQLTTLYSQKLLMTQLNQSQLKQQFFHTKPDLPVRFISMYAGDLYPIAPVSQDSILIFVDISPTSLEMLSDFAKKYLVVVIIDHHTSFQKCLEFIKEGKLVNVLYYWDERKCAAELVLKYLFESFGFPKNFPKQFQEQLYKHIQYVSNNDLKKNQDVLSKQFVLGFYYYQIQLTHHNPLLFKRIWSLNLQTILQKGKILYKQHIECLIKEVQECEIFQLVKGKYKGWKMLGSGMLDKGLISDLGSILAYLAVKNGFENLGMIYKKGSAQCKLSLRSCQFVEKQPKALIISQYYGGGGHHCAAGCTLAKKIFSQHFKSQGRLKQKIKLSIKQIQQILFFKQS